MIDEKKLLQKLAESLNVENVLEELKEKKTKEKRILENMKRAVAKMNGEEYVEQIEEPKPIIEETTEESVVEPEPIVEAIVEETPVPVQLVEVGRQPEPEIAKDNIINKYVQALSKATDQTGDAQEIANQIPDSYRKELDIIKKSIADFHRFAQRHSQLGGGGAGDILNLDHPTKTIYSNYTFTHKDYYIGAGVTPVTITLPTTAKNGRYIIIKDEVGNCSANPITVLGTVDNDSGGFILAVDNGGVQMIYNNGSWRIV